MSKKKLLFFAGDMTCVFARNEYDYMTNVFDEIIVFTYPGKEEKYEELSQTYNMQYKIVGKKIIKTCFSLSFIKWLMEKDVRKEILMNFGFTLYHMKKMAYILYYGLFHCEVQNIIKDSNMNTEGAYVYSYWLSRTAYAASRVKGANIKVSRAHGFDIYKERTPLNFLPFRKFIHDHLDEVCFISLQGKEYFMQEVYSNDCDKNKVFRLGSYNRVPIIKTLREKQKITIVSCSSIIQVKRLDLIIRVLSLLPNEFVWYHVGDGELRTELEKEAERYLKPDSYYFMGNVDNEKILSFYESIDADLFINLSDSEGIPVSIMEALSFGLPIIARNVGGMQEIVNDKNGVLIDDIENQEEVINKLTCFLKKWRMNKHRYLEYAVAIWKEKYNAEVNYKNFFSCLSDLISE